MASKVSPFVLFRRLPILFSRNPRFYSSPCAAHVQNLSESNRASPNSPNFNSAIRSLKNKLQPDRLILALESASDLTEAVSIFRWASRQKNFRLTPDTYTHIVLKLGAADDHIEMENLMKEMVKLEDSSLEDLGSLICSFCENKMPREAMKVFEFASSGNYKLPVSSCNALLGAVASKKGDFDTVLFIYKEMVKAGIFPDVETLNYLIGGLCDVGRLDSALDQYRGMSNKRCAPNSRTFEILICALCVSNRVEEALEILNQLLEMGCSPNLGFYNSIIPLLCRFDRFEEGTKLLRMMRGRNLSPDQYLYSALIECLCRNRRLDDAIELFEEMTDLGHSPMAGTFVDIVNGYCVFGDPTTALNFLEENTVLEVEPYNALLKCYCDVDRCQDAVCLLEKMIERESANNLSWNIIISGLCKRGFARKAFGVLCRMTVSSYVPDHDTYSSIITGYCKLGKYQDAFDKFRLFCINGDGLDSESCSELMEGLCRDKMIQEASKIFFYMIRKGYDLTASSLELLIQEMCLVEKLDEAVKLRTLAYRNGTTCTPLTYTAIMLRLLHSKKVKDVLPLLSQMLVEGCTWDVKTYCLVIRCLCGERTVREAALIFDRMIHDCFVPDTETLEMLVHYMAKCSQMHLVIPNLDNLIDEKDPVLTPALCNVVVSALLKEGHKHRARRFLDWMLDRSWVPDADTHSLLVGSINVEEMDRAIELYGYTGVDKVSSILAEGLESYVGDIVD